MPGLPRLCATRRVATHRSNGVPYEQAYIEGFEDMCRRVPDLGRLERTIGFRPRTPLTDIVADVIAYQRGQASASCQAPAKAGAVVPTLQPATP